MLREIVLDTETTGLSPAKGDRVVEIGCVELLNHIPTGNYYHTYLNPERDMPEEAFRVHGLSEEFLSDKPFFKDVKQGFDDFIQNSQLIIHNASFDMGFLNMELSKISAPSLTNFVIDTVQLARKKHPGARVGLDALCRQFGIDNSKRTLHGALLDSEILAEVYLELLGGRQVAMSLISEQENVKFEPAAPNKAYTQRPRSLVTQISPEQKQAHDALLQTLGETPLWQKYKS